MSINQPRLSRTMLPAAVFGFGIAATGLAVASSTTPSADEPDVSTFRADSTPLSYTGSKVDHLGPGMPSALAVSLALDHMKGSSITALRIVDAPATALDPEVPWLRVDLSSGAVSAGADVELNWESSLAQGAVTEMMHTGPEAANAVIGGSFTHQHLPSGEVRDLGGGAGFVATGQVFESQTEPRDEITVRSHVQQTLTNFDLTLARLRVLKPLGQAIAVTATIPPNADVTWTIDELRQALAGSPMIWDGIYLEIRDRDTDAPLIRSGVSYRTGLGGLWFAPGQDSRFSAGHGGGFLNEG